MSEGHIDVQVYDLQGRLIVQKHVDQQTREVHFALPATVTKGMYIVRVGSWSERLVVR